MKNPLFSIILFFLVFYTSSAQNKSYNLNDLNGTVFNEISISKNISSTSFNDARRLRDLLINPIVQSSEFMRVNDTILLDLFSNKKYKAYIDKIEVDVNGTLTIRARLIDYKYGFCIISTFNGKSLITIDVPEYNEFFMSRYDNLTNKYYLLEIDKSKQEILEGGPSMVPPTDTLQDINSKKKQQESTKNNESVANDSIILNDEISPDVVTLLIVYTPAAAEWASANETNINNTIGSLMTKAQLALDNSNTLLTIQLVHSEQVSYTELNSGADLSNLRNTADGFMDNVHSLRNTYCADVVVLLEKISYTGGQGYLLSSTSGSPTYAFSLTRVQQASTGYTTIHEIGHNMGLHHHKLQNTQPGPGLFSYSAGWRWTGANNGKYCSVMTYESGTYFADGITHTRVPYFSNPTIQYQGEATGDATDADNARTLRQTKSVVAAYRVGCCTPPTAPTVGTITSPTCSVPTGSVILNGLPSTGTWRLTRIPGGTITTGTGTSTTITGLPAGTYTFTLTNSSGCISSSSGSVVIIANPSTPVSPTIGTITQPTCSVATASVVLNSLPSTGTWTLTRTPGGINDTGTGTSRALSDLPAGIYTFTVTNAAGCISLASANVVINVQPITPNQPGTITGSNTVCQGSSQSYSISAVTGATTYNWTLPSGWTGSSTTRSITVTPGANSGNVSVTAVNSCGSSTARSLNVTVNTLPTQPGTIAGSNTVCQGTSQTYSISSVSGATSYTWTLPSGWSGSSSSTTITATVGASGGIIYVTANNTCGTSTNRSLNVSVTATPTQPGVISGATSVCQGTSQTYSISSVSGATSYTWTLPSGWSGSSVSTSITATVGVSGGIIYVTANNSCNSGTARSLSVSVTATPGQPGVISGATSVCPGTSQTYSISSVSGATSYTWTLPSGWSGSSGSTSITATAGASGGTIYVTANNTCGTSNLRALIVTIASVPSVITTAVSRGTSSSEAIAGGNITSNGGNSVYESGVCWSIAHNPTTSNSHTTDGTSMGSFTSTITGLADNETYFVRAYAKNSCGTGYGVEIQYYNPSNDIEDTQISGISVYPNPVSDILNIEYNSDVYKTLKILNSNGVLVEKVIVVVPRQQIDFSRYEYGIYFLEFVKQNGETKRLKVIHH